MTEDVGLGTGHTHVPSTMRKEYDFSKGKRGAVIASPGKTRFTIMLDDDLIEYFRALAETQGLGYQTLINSALREAAAAAAGKRKRAADRPLTESVLRKVLREELRAG
jgi:uncharacterized protein (DUF4415 family)